MNDIAKADPVGVIERAAAQERAAAFMAALVKAQRLMEPVARDMDNPSTKSRYASHAALDRAARAHYTACGLAVTYDTRPSPKGDLWITILGLLVHENGYLKEYTVDLLADGAGAKGSAVMTRTHAIGSAITYGKRQLLKMMFGLAEAGDKDDDDGNAAGKRQLLNEQELEVIKAVLEDAGCRMEDVARFCKTMKIEGLEQMRRDQIADAMQRIANFKAEYLKRKATGLEDVAKDT